MELFSRAARRQRRAAHRLRADARASASRSRLKHSTASATRSPRAVSLVRAARSLVEPARGGLREMLEELLARRDGGRPRSTTAPSPPARRRPRELWRIREAIAEAQGYEGGSDQARHLGAGEPRRRISSTEASAAVDARDARHPPRAVRPCRRRQHPFQPRPAGRRRQGGVSRALGRS